MTTESSGKKTIILDDDPTGIQTVHGCRVVVRPEVAVIRRAFHDSVPFFYVFTNTRSMPRRAARAEIKKWMALICEVNEEFTYNLTFISRSDSTLRSHFPLEVNIIDETVREKSSIQIAAIFVIPAFIEGGRITQGDVHYMIDSGKRMRVDRTEYARDRYFGFSTSYLPGYIEEKAEVPSGTVVSFGLEEIRKGTNEQILEKILKLSDRRYAVVNAESYDDLDRIAVCIKKAEEKGRKFLFQTAASFVRSYAGQKGSPLLDGRINSKGSPGLIIVGSFVRNTSRQLALLLEEPDIVPVELDTQVIKEFLWKKDLKRAERKDGVRKYVRLINKSLSTNKTPVLFTPREVIGGQDREESLRIGKVITQLLVETASAIDPAQCGYIIAKGGITSHTILSEGFSCSHAGVLGQILPGVPVISLGSNETPYVIFPGNVGEEDSLLLVNRLLSPNTP